MAVAAADALVDVHGHQAGFGVFVHCGGRAHLGARRVIAVIARHGQRIAHAAAGDAAVRIALGRAQRHLVHLAERGADAQVLEILAGHLAGFATRAASAVEMKCVSSHLLLLSYPLPLSLYDFADVGMLRIAL